MKRKTWNILRNTIIEERRSIYSEISNYPRPVADCDIQFDELLEIRSEVTLKLKRLDDARERKIKLSEFIKTL